jgi:gliding motility-associated-like protein
MKKFLCLFVLLVCFAQVQSQGNADCINSQPLCANPNFSFFSVPPPSYGLIDELTYPSISNPAVNPASPNAGCLQTNENNPQWLIITIGNAGMLEFVFGAANSPNPQAGFYDWAMWPYSPSACSQIFNNTLPPIRCNWNGTQNGGTGIASPSNIPVGGSQSNYEPPLAVNACQQFVICISNYSNINTLVSFQSLGTASLLCNPNCNPSYIICAGNSATINASNFANLTNPSFSIQPGGQVNNTGTFVVSPTVTTSYTTYVTGTNGANAVETTTGVSNVTVNPNPVVSPTFTQATCSNSVNAVNLNLSFSPPVASNYTITWSPVPPGPPSPTQTSVSGLNPGPTNVTVMASGGCSTTTSFNMGPLPSPANFTISPAGSHFLTCTNTLITLSTAPNNYTYTWISLSYTASGTAVSFTPGMEGTYTVTASNGINGCSTSQTVSIGQNTVAPTNSVSPASQAITCSSGSPVTFSGTVSDPTVNIQHDWYSPVSPLPWGVPIASSNNTISVLSGYISPPGVYTLVTTNLVNGCTSMKTITITSLNAFPTFSLASATNFSLGCAPLHQTTLSIINPISTQTPPATCSYTFLAPGFSGVVTPSIILGVNPSTITQIPGTWTIIVQDNSNYCRTTVSFPVIQNTVAPNVSATMNTQTLTCKHPTVLGIGVTSTPNTEINWLVPSLPPLWSNATLSIGPETGPNTSTTSLTYANYTVVATNTVNACQSSSVIVINQNFKPPVSSPTISIGTATAIYCTAAVNPAILTTGASTVTSGEPFAFVANPSWAGPSPQTPLSGPSTYSCFVPGIYSLTVEDSYNGCKKTGTINILDRTQPPVLASPLLTASLDCGANQANVSFVLTGTNTGGVRYLITRYPDGAAFTPSSVIIFDQNQLLSGTSSTLVSVSKTGQYRYVVSNTLTGCQAQGTVVVVPGVLNADFEANPSAGFAPLTVNFVNNTNSSFGAEGITSVWSYGNGTSQTFTSMTGAAASYISPGTYTVMLLTSKGVCLDTMYKVIKVELPSKMEVPNIFTPNGDGSNDTFFLKVANMSQIQISVFDRWGAKVYETNSSTGNVAWDGKNFQGKDCAAGIYYYVLNGEGGDGVQYEQKGNVSLFR